MAQAKLAKTTIFIVTPMKKHIWQFTLLKGVCCQFVDRNVVCLVPKYYLLAGDANQDVDAASTEPTWSRYKTSLFRGIFEGCQY